MTQKKSDDARFQIQFWSRLLEGRIALQKLILASRELETKPADDSTIKSTTKLLSCLIRLRDTYRANSQFNLPDDKLQSDEVYANIDDDLLDSNHENYNSLREDLIEKWYEKTKIGTIPKKGYTALELPTLQLIKNALKDKERLIIRTRVDQSAETFNDDEFYHILLREVISKEERSKWVELQRRKYKSKRKVDTKATKGRKIDKKLILKLVNFMAPRGGKEFPDQKRRELIKSLFGGAITT